MTFPFQTPKPAFILGPDGKVLTLANLPAPGHGRWLPRQKAEVIRAVDAGLLSFEDAVGRYNLTVQEFADWKFALNEFGIGGLRTTRTKIYRAAKKRSRKPQQAAGSPALHHGAETANRQ